MVRRRSSFHRHDTLGPAAHGVREPAQVRRRAWPGPALQSRPARRDDAAASNPGLSRNEYLRRKFEEGGTGNATADTAPLSVATPTGGLGPPAQPSAEAGKNASIRSYTKYPQPPGPIVTLPAVRRRTPWPPQRSSPAVALKRKADQAADAVDKFALRGDRLDISIYVSRYSWSPKSATTRSFPPSAWT